VDTHGLISFPVGRIVCRGHRKLSRPDTTHLHLAKPTLPGRPTPDSSSLIGLDAPAWKPLINRTFFSSHEFVSLFEAIFTSEDEIEKIRDLPGDDAQTFADLVQQVHSIPLFMSCGLIISALFGSFTFEPLPPLIRLWISSISHRRFGGSVWSLCGGSAPATLCSLDHSKSHPATINRTRCGTPVGMRMCGRANIKAVQSQSRF